MSHLPAKDSSCIRCIDRVAIPVLFVSSMDDPVVDHKCIPHKRAQENPNLMFAITNRGGHCAFLQNFRWWNKAWRYLHNEFECSPHSDCVIEEFLAAVLRTQGEESSSIREDQFLLAR